MSTTVCHCRYLSLNSTCGTEAMYSCKCRQTKRVVKLRPDQRQTFRQLMSESGDMHKLYHKYCREVGRLKESDRTGYEFMEWMQCFSKRNPAVLRVGVDDDCHAGSDVYLIPHESRYELWGVTVLYIPQCTGEKPIRFFLYPNHLRAMMKALEVMAKTCRSHGNRTLSGCWENESKPNAHDGIPKSITLKSVRDNPSNWSPPKPISKAKKKKLAALRRRMKRQAAQLRKKKS